jgi:hypothetical protein
MKKTKKYEYFYPELKELGNEIRGMGGIITRQLLKNKYSHSYVSDVMMGRRKNEEIIAAMRKMQAMLEEIK